MAAELAQVQDHPARWRFAVGCARTAIFSPLGNRAAVGIGGRGDAAAALVTGVALPAGRVFVPVFVGVVGGLATLAVARSRPLGWAGRSVGVAALALVGIAGSIGARSGTWPSTPRPRSGHPPTTSATLSPVTAVVLAGSVAAAVAGRSFRSGLAASAWATVLGALLVILTWLAEAPRWYRQGRGLLLDGDGGGMGANLSDAILVDPDRPGAVGAARRRARRRCRERTTAPPECSRARRSSLRTLNATQVRPLDHPPRPKATRVM